MLRIIRSRRVRNFQEFDDIQDFRPLPPAGQVWRRITASALRWRCMAPLGAVCAPRPARGCPVADPRCAVDSDPDGAPAKAGPYDLAQYRPDVSIAVRFLSQHVAPYRGHRSGSQACVSVLVEISKFGMCWKRGKLSEYELTMIGQVVPAPAIPAAQNCTRMCVEIRPRWRSVPRGFFNLGYSEPAALTEWDERTWEGRRPKGATS